MGRARTVENIVYSEAHTKQQQQQHVISAPGETGWERNRGSRLAGGEGFEITGTPELEWRFNKKLE